MVMELWKKFILVILSSCHGRIQTNVNNFFNHNNLAQRPSRSERIFIFRRVRVCVKFQWMTTCDSL